MRVCASLYCTYEHVTGWQPLFHLFAQMVVDYAGKNGYTGGYESLAARFIVRA